MMRKIWVNVDPWNKALVTAAIEGGADAVRVPEGFSEKVKQLGLIRTLSEDGDLKPGEDVVCFTIQSGEDEETIVKLSRQKQVIVTCSDWTVIPLENLIARGAEVIAQVSSFEEAQTAFGILEKGVRHLMVHTDSVAELKKILSLLGSDQGSTPLETAEITDIRAVGMGDRVCIDTCTSMMPGQGMLVGNSSSALFLIHSESVSNPYVAPRPFRVNAGAVHAYIRVPEGKTRYLSELTAGDPVLIVDFQGKTTVATVGRIKIEKRPMMLIQARAGERMISTIVQNAETIRLTDPEGHPVSVVRLAPGDKVRVAVETCARHFGYKIEETITER
ncbi:MAG: 3-dehydroquinate synthase II [Desulfobacterales bacterium]|nr:3-dehydroquinate synthase II [Desulfobacterales bacterium]MDD4073086.1 3-dehydroquinate synthase II [Desulfobacterales bacterium]MDD4393494.1 3-dehydroquinate synthase II [Desulfobacterales bacterium]